MEAQWAEITNLTDTSLGQTKTITDQKAACKIVYDVVKASHDELITLGQQLTDEIAALKGEAAGQMETVATITNKIKTALVIQW